MSGKRPELLKEVVPNLSRVGAFWDPDKAANGRVSALVTVTRALILSYPNRVAELAIKNRLPSIHERNER